MTRRLPELRHCLECSRPFHPCRKKQDTCSRSCGAARRVRRFPGQHHQMVAAQAAKQAAYAKRLGERLRSMTKGEIWRLAHQRGYQAGYLRAMKVRLGRQDTSAALDPITPYVEA